MNLKELREPFDKADIEWRIGRGGIKQDGQPWAMVLAYLTNRAIMDRLDQVCGVEGWQNQYMTAPSGGVLCGISVYIPERDAWITKWDGAENTDIESVKGGLSASMKRAAVQWGMGRYLYKLENSFATIVDRGTPGSLQGRVKDKSKKDHAFYYLPPELPNWALPSTAQSIMPNDTEKELFDRAVEEENDTLLWALKGLLDEEVYIALYGSFPKGKITERKQVVRKLEKAGHKEWNDLVHDVHIHIRSKNVCDLKDIVGGLENTERKYLAKRLGKERTEQLRQLLSDIKD